MNSLKQFPALALVLLLCSTASFAQHNMHNMNPAGPAGMETMPTNDELLATAPDQLMLHFPEQMTLVKLVLKNPENDFIDINFRFRPGAAVHFMQALPELAVEDYYEVEWAALDAMGTLLKGTFYFSFGADAKAPSFYLNQEGHEMNIMSPDYRLL